MEAVTGITPLRRGFAVLGLVRYNQYMGKYLDLFDKMNEQIDYLIKKEEALEKFLDASPWGMIAVNEKFEIRYVNTRFEKMSGYTSDELIGKSLHVLMPKADRKAHVAHEKEYIKAPHEREGNHGLKPLLLCKDGTLLRVEISLGVSEVEGKEYYFASLRRFDSLFNSVEGKEKGT